MSKLDKFPSDCRVPKKCKKYLMSIKFIFTKPINDMSKRDWLKLYAFANAVGIIDIDNQ